MLLIVRGLTLSLTEGRPAPNLPPEFRNLGQYELSFGPWALPLPLIVMLILALLVSLLLHRTVLGRYIYTLGSNERALVIAGVATTRLKVLVYTLCGLLTALSGLIMTARVGVAAPTAAAGYELDIIGAVVIGGTSLYGGEGSVVGVLLGTVLMQVVRTGLFLLGVPGQWQNVVIGAMIVLVALLDYWRRRRVMV
jgi:ribose transport system permease protein